MSVFLKGPCAFPILPASLELAYKSGASAKVPGGEKPAPALAGRKKYVPKPGRGSVRHVPSLGTSDFISVLREIEQNHPALAYLTCGPDFPDVQDFPPLKYIDKESKLPIELILDYYGVSPRNDASGAVESWNQRFPSMGFDGVASFHSKIQITSEYDFLWLHSFAYVLNARIFVLWQPRRGCAWFSLALGPLSGADFDIVLAAKKAAVAAQSQGVDVTKKKGMAAPGTALEVRSSLVFTIVTSGYSEASNSVQDSGKGFFRKNPCLRILELQGGKYVAYYAQAEVSDNVGLTNFKSRVKTHSSNFPVLRLKKKKNGNDVLELGVPEAGCPALVDSFTQTFGSSPAGRMAIKKRKQPQGVEASNGFLVSEGFNTHYVLVKQANRNTSERFDLRAKRVELSYSDLTTSLLGENEEPMSFEEIAKSEYLKAMCNTITVRRIYKGVRFVKRGLNQEEVYEEETDKQQKAYVPVTHLTLSGQPFCFRWITTAEMMSWGKEAREGFLDVAVQRVPILKDVEGAKWFTDTDHRYSTVCSSAGTLKKQLRSGLLALKETTSEALIYVVDKYYKEQAMIIRLAVNINDKSTQNSFTFSVSTEEMEDVRTLPEFLARLPRSNLEDNVKSLEDATICFPVLITHMESILRNQPRSYPEIPRKLKGKIEDITADANISQEQVSCELTAYELHEIVGHRRITPTSHSVVYTTKEIKYAFLHKDLAVFVCATDSAFFIYHGRDTSCVLDSMDVDYTQEGSFCAATFSGHHKCVIVAYKCEDEYFLKAFPLDRHRIEAPEALPMESEVTQLTMISLSYLAAEVDGGHVVFDIDEDGEVIRRPEESWMVGRIPNTKEFLKQNGDNFFWDDDGVWEVTESSKDKILEVSRCGAMGEETDDCAPRILPRLLRLATKKEAADHVLLPESPDKQTVESLLIRCFPVLIASDGALIQYHERHFVRLQPDTTERLLDVRLRQFYKTCISSVCLFGVEKFIFDAQPDVVDLLTIIDVPGTSARVVDRVCRTAFASVSVKGVLASLTRLPVKDAASKSITDQYFLVVYVNEDTNAAVTAALSCNIGKVIVCAETGSKAIKQMKRDMSRKSARAMSWDDLSNRTLLAEFLAPDATSTQSDPLEDVRKLVALYLTHRMFSTLSPATIHKFCQESE